MKQFLYTLLIAILLISCNQNNPNAFIEGEKYVFNLSFKLSEIDIASRSFQDNISTDDFPPLWIVVFDNNGYLIEYAQASNFSKLNNITNCSVTLTASAQKSIIHLLLNYSNNDPNLSFGHENNIIGSLFVKNNKDTYWQRIELPEGINEVSMNQYMKNIPLLRNFLKVSVFNNDNNFEFEGFSIINVPNTGTVAPFYNGKFVDWKEPKTYQEIVSTGYIGIMPDSVVYINIDATRPTWQNDPFYLYEKPFFENTTNIDKTTTVLIKGKYKGAESSYYKVDIIYKDGSINKYYHLLRNFEYIINLDKVTGNGHSTALAAAKGVAGNNIQSSIELHDLLNISDGNSTLYVSYTDTILTTTNTITLKYKYIPNMAKPNTVANDLVQIQKDNSNKIFSSIENNTSVDNNGWSTIILTPNMAMPTSAQIESIVLYLTNNNLSRKITYTLRPKYDMFLHCTPWVIDSVGAKVNADIYIPEGLSPNMFPLTFKLTAVSSAIDGSKLPYISPANGENGDDIYTEIEEKTLYYIKMLSFESYTFLPLNEDKTKRIITCHFITNTNKSASTIIASNKYFYDASNSFNNISLSWGEYAAFYGNQTTNISLPNGANFKSSNWNVSANNSSIVSLTTTLWDTPIQIQILYNNETITLDGPTRTKIKMKLTALGNNIPNNNTNITIKKENTTIASKPWSELKQGVIFDVGTKTAISTQFSFSYTNNNITYTATTLAEDLVNNLGTTLTFSRQ